MNLCGAILLLGCCSLYLVVSGAFTNRNGAAHGGRRCTILLASVDPHKLLYQDQQQAMHRRALREQDLLSRNSVELKAPKIKATPVKAGTGFGNANMDPTKRLAEAQARIVHRDGVLRIDRVLRPELVGSLREYVLEQKALAEEETTRNPGFSRDFYGVEQERKHRCDLQLSLLRGGYAADKSCRGEDEFTSHILADVLQELLGAQGSLRPLYENLVSLQGDFYELAVVVTDPGSDRQIIHPDLPFQSPAPLYVIFLALQDINESMGPTSFLLGTHTAKENTRFNNEHQRDSQLSTADCRVSTLNEGDAVIFDARILHCGNANDSTTSRALFNLSFRSPAVTGNLGYDGSMRPGYVGAMKLQDVSNALESYEKGDKDPFSKFGNGVSTVH